MMDFVRKGMNNAQPRFAVWEGEEREHLGGLMQTADKMGSTEIDHPDARLIAAAPKLLEALKAFMEASDIAKDITFAPAYKFAEMVIAKAEGKVKV